LVNSGRLSLPSTYSASSLNTLDAHPFASSMCPGSPASDAPILLATGKRDWFVQQLGEQFCVVLFTDQYQTIEDLPNALVWQVLPQPALGNSTHEQVIIDVDGLIAQRYDAKPGTTYLFRPDQHVAARWRQFDQLAIQSALSRACLQEQHV
jgi:3-(3-hydroxy-phenyl)propionate hydroxylase